MNNRQTNSNTFLYTTSGQINHTQCGHRAELRRLSAVDEVDQPVSVPPAHRPSSE
ncbi:MAG: hypothetical protein K2L17_05510 [Muribaculaceae bacterium]|nr:hypothetical protein [Muribaculaceae bacterium]